MDDQARTSWLTRNWKWFVPVACVGALLLFVGGIFQIVSLAMKSSDAYVQAVEIAKADPAVVQALGTPISEGLLPTGNIHVSGSSGDARLAIPISGPKGSGTIYLEARKSMGEWSFGKLVFASATNERTDLLAHAAKRNSSKDTEPANP